MEYNEVLSKREQIIEMLFGCSRIRRGTIIEEDERLSH